MKLHKTCEKRFILYVVLALAILVILLLFSCNLLGFTVSKHEYRLASTRTHLALARGEISRFKEINGRYPNSLEEVKEYAQENPNSGLHGEFFWEFLSHRKGNGKEHTLLNNEGGLYYNKNTGELRINLTNTLKHYLKLIFGDEKNEIPAYW